MIWYGGGKNDVEHSWTKRIIHLLPAEKRQSGRNVEGIDKQINR